MRESNLACFLVRGEGRGAATHAGGGALRARAPGSVPRPATCLVELHQRRRVFPAGIDRAGFMVGRDRQMSASVLLTTEVIHEP
jgi:hypothetical protein